MLDSEDNKVCIDCDNNLGASCGGGTRPTNCPRNNWHEEVCNQIQFDYKTAGEALDNLSFV
jgi:hypothetical protein